LRLDLQISAFLSCFTSKIPTSPTDATYPGLTPNSPTYATYPALTPTSPTDATYPGLTPTSPTDATYPGPTPTSPTDATYPELINLLHVNAISVPNRQSSKLLFIQNVWQYRMWPSRNVGGENVAIVSVMPAATVAECVGGRTLRVQSDIRDMKIQVFCDVTVSTAHTIWYVPSHRLHTQSGAYRHTCFTHNLVRTVTHASHILWYVPLLMLHT
jgi:hypothetical protein